MFQHICPHTYRNPCPTALCSTKIMFKQFSFCTPILESQKEILDKSAQKSTCKSSMIPHYFVNCPTTFLSPCPSYVVVTCSMYRISRPIRHTFIPEKCDLKSTCILCAEGKYYFQTYKYPYQHRVKTTMKMILVELMTIFWVSMMNKLYYSC